LKICSLERWQLHVAHVISYKPATNKTGRAYKPATDKTGPVVTVAAGQPGQLYLDGRIVSSGQTPTSLESRWCNTGLICGEGPGGSDQVTRGSNTRARGVAAGGSSYIVMGVAGGKMGLPTAHITAAKRHVKAGTKGCVRYECHGRAITIRHKAMAGQAQTCMWLRHSRGNGLHSCQGQTHSGKSLQLDCGHNKATRGVHAEGYKCVKAAQVGDLHRSRPGSRVLQKAARVSTRSCWGFNATTSCCGAVRLSQVRHSRRWDHSPA